MFTYYGNLMRRTLKQIKKIIIGVVGITVLAIGILMILSPGPAILVIPFGLSILATEFLWAEKMLKRFKNSVNYFTKKTKNINPEENSLEV